MVRPFVALKQHIDGLSGRLYRSWFRPRGEAQLPTQIKTTERSRQGPALTRQARPAPRNDIIEPVRPSGGLSAAGTWTGYLVFFLRLMAAVSIVKGLYHWAQVCGIGAGSEGGFEAHTVAWQAATVFFAVIDLVAAVGLWLAAAWGAVVWLTSLVSMAAVEIIFPSIYGGSVAVVVIEMTLLIIYLSLAIVSARERPG